jgi:dinuclear metal center YbgI/SA1388 family protein
MTVVRDVTRYLDELAPARLAEPWDNIGLLWGNPDDKVQNVMTCLTVTPTTAQEAIQQGAELIVSHHPVLFREVKRIRADVPETSYLWKLARAGIAIASLHTAFDNAPDGINDILCRRLDLVDVTPLRPAARQIDSVRSFKVVVFTPASDHEAVIQAAFGAGAGCIGAYEECSFSIPGEGTFFGTDASNPTVGERGRRETVQELRVEVVCLAPGLAGVLAAIRAAHSYEEPAIDVYPLSENQSTGTRSEGAGRVGRLIRKCALRDLATLVRHALGAHAVAVAGDAHRLVERVAVACGAGGDFLRDAAHAQANALLTGEARFHSALEAEATGIGLVVAGHHATERPGVELLAARLGEAFPNLRVWASTTECDPFQWIAAATP